MQKKDKYPVRKEKLTKTSGEVHQKKASPNTSFESYRYVHYVALLILTFLVYGWTYNFEYSLSDPYILNALNNTENNLHGFFSVFKQTFAVVDFRPISILSFWMERFLFDQVNPHISHFVNVLLYGFILIKIYDFILVSKFYEDQNKLILLAILSSLFFLVHPNHVGVVANIKSRDNLLSMLFGIMGAIQFIKMYDYKENWRILLFFGYTLLGYLSKLDVYIFLLLPLMVIFFYRTPPKKTFLYLIIGSFLTISIVSNLNSFIKPETMTEHGFILAFDKNPLAGNDTLLNRLSLSFTTLFYYIKFLIIPFGYHFIFGYNQIPLTGLFAFKNICAAFIMLSLLLFSIKMYKRNKIYLFSFGFYVLGIAYALNFFVIISNILMDRYNFIPSLAFCIALSAIFIDFYDIRSLQIFKKPPILILILLWVSFTVYRTNDWRNLITLVEHDMPYLTNSVNANRIAGSAYINIALQEEMKPNYNKAYADSMINIGEKYTLKGIELYDQEVELWQSKGLCLFYRKDYPAALSCFLKCKEIDSTYLSGINYIGFTYWKLNKIDSAYYYFNNVMKKETQYGYSANNMINMLMENNRKAEADSIIDVLKKRFPDDVWLNNRIQELDRNR